MRLFNFTHSSLILWLDIGSPLCAWLSEKTERTLIEGSVIYPFNLQQFFESIYGGGNRARQ
jgi:hypothetical protein